MVGLTNKAIKYLREKNVKVKKVGRGGPVHFYWCLTLRNHFQGLGYETKMEAEIADGVYTDILLIKPNQRIGVEVVVSDKDKRTLKKIGRLLNLVDGVIVAFTRHELKKRIEMEAEEAIGKELKGVRFSLVQDFQ